MCPYLHNNINKKQSTANQEPTEPLSFQGGQAYGTWLQRDRVGGVDTRVSMATAWGWARRRESNGVEGTQQGPPSSPASLTDLEGDTGVASEGQNSCRNHASKFPEFRGPVRQAPRQGCGQSGGGKGKRNSSALYCAQDSALPGLRFSVPGPKALAETKIPCKQLSVVMTNAANFTGSRIV